VNRLYSKLFGKSIKDNSNKKKKKTHPDNVKGLDNNPYDKIFETE
jgi:hypothetical protein